MKLIISSTENDEISPITYAALCSVLAQNLISNRSNDGTGTVFGGSFMLGNIIYQYEVTPNNNR